MTLSDKTIEPDLRKGLLYLRRSAGDGQIHFHWMDRRTGAIELDILVAPLGHLEFRKVEACLTGRVYVLKFCNSTQRYYFWMQEPDMQRDVEFCQFVNELIDGGGRRRRQRDETSAAEGDVDSVTSGCVERNLQWPRGRGGGTENLAILEEMREIFAKTLADEQRTTWRQTVQSRVHLPVSLGEAEVEAEAIPDPVTRQQQQTMMRLTPQVDLAEALCRHGTEAMENLLTSPNRRQALIARLPFQDPETETEEEAWAIREHLRSQQFHRALSYFFLGLQSGALRLILEPLLSQDEALEAAQAGDIEHFLRVLHRNERD